MTSSVRKVAGLLALSLLLSGTAWAGDGKPFLMKVGTGSTLTDLPPNDLYQEMMSVAIAPKKGGLCVVTGGFTAALSNGPISVTLSTSSATAGPWVQLYENDLQYVSGTMTQAFVVTKNVPVTFYMNGSNSGSSSVQTENTRIWVICEQEKAPVLP